MDFGKGLMPGEGVAMAEFVANGQVNSCTILKFKNLINNILIF
jgi:hypothetical protein